MYKSQNGIAFRPIQARFQSLLSEGDQLSQCAHDFCGVSTENVASRKKKPSILGKLLSLRWMLDQPHLLP